MKTIKWKWGEDLGAMHARAIESLEKSRIKFVNIHRRQRWFYRWLQKNMPLGLWDKVEIRLDDLGLYDIYCQIDILERDDQSTILAVEWLIGLGDKWKFKKTFSELNGVFTYEAVRFYGMNEYRLYVGNVANIDGCKIVKKRKMRTVYETDCNGES